MTGDEGSSTTGGSNGESEGTAGSAVPHKAPKTPPSKSSASGKKTEQKLNNSNSRGGK